MATEQQIVEAIRLAVSSTVSALLRESPECLKSKGDVEQVVKRTDVFKGENFQDWKFKLEMTVQSANLKAYSYMQTCEQLDDELDADHDIPEESKDFNTKLYYILTQRTSGESFDLVRNVSDLNGGEAWRRLCKRFGGRTTGKRVHLTRKCVNPPRVKKLSEAMSMVEKWESNMRRLTTDYKETMSDGLKAGILLEMMPSAVTEIMTQRIKEGDSYATVKESLLRYIETKEDFGGTAPMDLDRLEFHDHYDEDNDDNEEVNVIGKGGGKGSQFGKGGGGSGNFNGNCNRCGVWGHRAAKCPNKETCYHCGQPGHRLAQCPAKDAEMKGGGGKGFNKGGWQKGHFGEKGAWKGGGWKGKDGPGKGGKGYTGKGYPTWSVYDQEDGGEQDPWSLSLFGLNADYTEPIKVPYPRHALAQQQQQQHYQQQQRAQQQHAQQQRTQQQQQFQIPLMNRYSLLGCLTADTGEDEQSFIDQGCHEEHYTRKERTHGGDTSQHRRDRPRVRKEQVEKSHVQQQFATEPVICARTRTASSAPYLHEECEEIPDEVMALFDPDVQLHYVPRGPTWRKVETVMDSGAAESVAPVELAPWVKLEASEGSRRGQTYLAAGGEKLPNLGEKKLEVFTSEGRPATATFQCADVTRALSSVSKICDRGNRVVFDVDGGFIVDKSSGARTNFRRENNVYVLDMFMLEPEDAVKRADFARQSA